MGGADVATGVFDATGAAAVIALRFVGDGVAAVVAGCTTGAGGEGGAEVGADECVACCFT